MIPKKKVVDITPEARMNRLADMALDQIEKDLAQGTCKASVLVELLKYTSPKRKEEEQKVRNENELLKAKVSAIKSSESSEKLYSEAIKAMREYTGKGGGDEEL